VETGLALRVTKEMGRDPALQKPTERTRFKHSRGQELVSCTKKKEESFGKRVNVRRGSSVTAMCDREIRSKVKGERKVRSSTPGPEDPSEHEERAGSATKSTRVRSKGKRFIIAGKKEVWKKKRAITSGQERK